MLRKGDKVTIKKNLKEIIGAPEGSIVEDMLRYQGMKTTIRWGEKDERGEVYVIDIDDGRWAWDVKMFEAVEKRPRTYQEHIEDMIEHCKDMLLTKHTEYATEDDFHNFNVAAALQNVTPQQALIGMMDKHVVSVHDLVNEQAEGREILLDKWKEKIGDNIDYLLILWAMVNMSGKEIE